ncbi:MAG: alcohol dehydrogenase catalytic domain-containing protein [Planctomycetes bacterium]|nr:alcohol dehydrogenase catalytic domain-containing protein [Planctomycetota bacterium]
MKALVFYAPGNCKIEDVQSPTPDNGEILVKVNYAGVCGTDVRIYKGTKKIKAPRIIGHEFAGEIIEIGKGVNEYKAGERVTVYPVLFCGECYACRAGRKNICLNRITLGYELDGGFAEFLKIPRKAVEDGNVVRLPDNISYEEGAISEMVAAAYNGILKANVKEGQSIVIIGAGPIGLCHVILSRLRRPKKIIVSEPDKDKRGLALKLGADYIIDPKEISVKEEILARTNNEGADIVFIDVGLKDVIENAFSLLKKGGTYILFAGCPEGTKITLDPNMIHYREILFTGSSASTPECQKEILNLVSSKKIDIKPLITDILPLAEWQMAFESKGNYKALKLILQIT